MVKDCVRIRVVAVCVLLAGLCPRMAAAPPVRQGTAPPGRTGVVFQFSTISALMTGLYDGEMTFGRLARYGDTGIGTLDALDGEMVALGGRFYQARSDGRVLPVPAGALTPFASVVFFQPSSVVRVKGPLTYADLEKRLEALSPMRNVPYAYRIRARCSLVRVRSVPRQKRPYPKLVEVAKRQSVFERRDVEGVLVGFRTPDYMTQLNVPGFHLHFLSADRKFGGHILACSIEGGSIEVQRCGGLEVAFPRARAFGTADLAGDIRSDLGKVEKERR